MVFGEERLFIIEYPDVPPGIKEFILRFVGKDLNGLKMKGKFPRVWIKETGRVSGPLLFDEGTIYEAVMMDYDKDLLWINQVFDNL